MKHFCIHNATYQIEIVLSGFQQLLVWVQCCSCRAHTKTRMRLETKLEAIKQFALKNRDNNKQFSIFLENQDTQKVDMIVHRLNNTISPNIDCTTCGNCCLNLRPEVSNDVLSQFIDLDKIEEVKYDMAIQCKHLKNKKCSQYHKRPQECRFFPYMERTGFVSRISGILQNYEICPIVFNIVEQLKKELRWNQ